MLLVGKFCMAISFFDFAIRIFRREGYEKEVATVLFGFSITVSIF